MNAVHVIFGSLFTIAVGFGVLALLLKDPTKTNTLFGASADSIIKVTNSLEGRSAA